MQRVRFVIATGIVGVVLASCGGVDREGTRDNIIESFQDELGQELDAECVDGVLDEYSDDELESIDDAINDGEETEAAMDLVLKIFECAPTGG
ncbi:MAG: hypothetical protein KDB40_00890 [Acidimicrobiales bacterium]|nr:hypothetical protein [Acidimicrobiales bacterium]MCB9395050.1 hypothetical protein [Acidimicrobiaceae bacterium]